MPVEMEDEMPLSIANREPKFLEGSQLLHELVQTCSTSNHPAIDFWNDDDRRDLISYPDLHSRSDIWAARIRALLRNHAQEKRTVIPVLLPQSAELYIVLLAVLKAGAAFCPLNLDAPAERIKFIVDDTSATLVITNSGLRNRFASDSGVRLLVTDDGDESLQTGSAPATGIRPSDAAYIMYTSGSTGTPKGVVVSHRAVTQSLLAHDRHIPRFSRFFQFASPTFDVSMFEIFFTLYRGATIVSCDRKTLLNDLPCAINRMEVDAAELTPTVAGSLLQTRESVPQLKLLLTIGEMLTPQIVQEFGGSPSRKSILWGMYGPTECAIHCTLQPDFQSSDRVGCVGIPLDTVSAIVISPASSSLPSTQVDVLPVGDVGELALGGHQLADGYLNREEQTASAFIESKSFGRLYRTGDKARMLPNGQFECLGRISGGQVKLRGQRVELGEIEHVVLKVPDCRACIAIVISGVLVVFCLAPNEMVSDESIRNMCESWLPAFMVPRNIILLSSLPRLPSGKVDKERLKSDFEESRISSLTNGVLPQDEVGANLQKTIQAFLGQDVDEASDLASLGVDSLSAIKIASTLGSMGYDINAMDVLAAGTVLELHSTLTQSGAGVRNPEITKQKGELFRDTRESSLRDQKLASKLPAIEDVIDCTPLQAAMLSETSAHPRAYCNWIELELPGSISFDSVKEAFQQLASRNQILRTGFLARESASYSYAQIIWKSLSDDQFQRTSRFTRDFQLPNQESLLRPFRLHVLIGHSSVQVLIQIHHALYDGWSFDLLSRDLDLILRKRDLTERPQYRAVTEYYSDIIAASHLETSREYWRKQMTNYQPLSLPNLNGFTGIASDLMRSQFACSTSMRRIRSRARELGIGAHVFFQAALAYTIANYNGTGDIAFGTVNSGRTIPVKGIEDIMGPCISTLPLRVRFAETRTIGDLLHQVHELNRSMLSHGQLPLAEVKRAAGFSPGQPMFDSLFVWQETLESHANQERQVRIVDSADQLEFNLTLEVEPQAEHIVLRATYQRAVWPEAQVKLLFEQIDRIVDLAQRHPDADLDSINTRLQPDIVSILNSPPDLQQINHCPSHAVEQKALETPEKPALAFYHALGVEPVLRCTLSYSELNSRANKICDFLRTQHIKSNDLVCIFMEKSVDLYASILASLKSGAGYLPITPGTPFERVRSIHSDAQAKICLTTHEYATGLRGIFDSVIEIDYVDLSKLSDDNPTVPYVGSSIAYTIFTSGSTGKPKGVLVTRQNLASNIKVLGEIYPARETSRFLQSCSQAFDVSVFEIFYAWSAGMCLCAASKDDLFKDFERSARVMGITHMSLTSAVASLVDPKNIPNVKFLVTAGDALTNRVHQRWAGRGLHQGYGPSETTNICTMYENIPQDAMTTNLGKPLKNTSVFVLETGSEDITLRGGVGELCFGGDQVGAGYLNMSELTASKFIQHPRFGRLYRSGDLGRLLPDGSIKFIGRLDGQVKIRGQRVEIGEIDRVVSRHPSVRNCATVLVQDDSVRSDRLAVFWATTDSERSEYGLLEPDAKLTDDITSIRGYVSERLPDYMIPSAFIPVAAIPTTDFGKVDKRRLSEVVKTVGADYLDAVTGELTDEDDLPALSDTDQMIIQGLSHVLGIPESSISLKSSFLGLGLDSISAISLSTFIRNHHGSDVPVSTILKHPTVGALSRKITGGSIEKPIATSSLEKLFSDDFMMQIKAKFKGQHIVKVLPCTPLQEAMLSTDFSGPDSAYFNRMLFRFSGNLEKLQKAWSVMSERHEILRTCFVSSNDPQFAFVQVVLSHFDPNWSTIPASESDKSSLVRLYAEEHSTALLDDQRPPWYLASVGSGESRLILFCCHHAIYDGVAISRLLQEVEMTYRDETLPATVPFEPFLANVLSASSEESMSFWKAQLHNFEPSAFPDLTGKSLSTRKSLTGRSVYTNVLSASLSSLEVACRKFESSLLALCQAAWAKCLSIYQAEDDLCFGNVVSGRTLPVPNLDRLVAPCFNTVPIRAAMAKFTSNTELIRHLQELNADILPYQLTPLRKIQSTVSTDGRRLCDTLFILQQSSIALDDSIWQLEEDAGVIDFPLVCEVVPDRERDTLSVVLHHQHSVILDKDTPCIFRTFASAVQSCINTPSASISDFSCLPKGLLATSKTQQIYYDPQSGPLLHSGAEMNAQLRPDLPALEFYDAASGQRERWTFETLNNEANRIAHALKELNMQVEDAVPVCIPKSPLFYASILGILKAGAAFTPFDTQLPSERKRFMMKELEAKVVLCTEESDAQWCEGARLLNVADLRHHSTDNLSLASLQPESLAYRLYTSGSTGQPKAVAVEHRSPVQTIESSRRIIPWSNDTRLLQFAATTFDMCYYDCFLAWTFGFCLCAAEQKAMLNHLPNLANALGVTMLDLTPSVAASLRPDQIPTLDYLYCIGEEMPQSVIDRWGGRCVNSYGPTEAAFCCTIFPVDSDTKSSVIGEPFPTSTFCITSRESEAVVPVFGVGELLIGGPQVARGYHANAELTRSRFVERDGKRFYKSGDLARMLPDGNFEFMGRADDQVKIRGLRVELGEINSVIRNARSDIADVSTQIFTVPDSSNKQLVTFIAAKPAAEQHKIKQSAQAAASTHLPVYMVPKFFLIMDKIPLSAAGKVDKKALFTTFRESEELATSHIEQDMKEDWTPTEDAIRRILSTLSQTPEEHITRNTTIYQLGLDSISAVQVAAQLRDIDLSVSAADVIEHSTCSGLAAFISNNDTRKDGDTPVDYDFEAFEQQFWPEIKQSLNISSKAVASIRPCTPLQCGLISRFLQSSGHEYFNYVCYEVDTDLAIDALRSAWASAVAKFPILRTGFAHTNDHHSTFAMITYHASDSEVPCAIAQTSNCAEQGVQSWIEDSAEAVLQRIHEPAWRLLLSEGNGTVKIHFAALHALYDAHSLQLILRDVAAAARGKATSRTEDIDSTLGHLMKRSSEEHEDTARFWREMGEKTLITHFPEMIPLQVKTGQTRRRLHRLSISRRELEVGCRKANITIQTAGQASWARVLSAYIGDSNVTFGIILSGRTTADSENVAFPCITTLPLPSHNDPSNRALLDSMMQYNASVQRHQFAPLTRIQAWMGHAGEQVFDTVFTYQKTSVETHHRIPWKVVEEKATADYTVSIELQTGLEDELEFVITFRDNKLPTEQAELVLKQLDAVLKNLVTYPDGHDIDIECPPQLYSITPAEKPTLPSTITLLHEFVELSSRKYSDRIALEFVDRFEPKIRSKLWTYEELDREGNRVADLLCNRGITPGSLIGICFDKCPEASFAMLGVLKAGCAFVALDPGAPTQRKLFITKDSGAVLILSMRQQSFDFSGNAQVPVVNLDDAPARNLSARAPQLSRQVSPQDVCYCLYTSGTTGTPKGCEITHENVVQALLSFQHLFAGHWDDTSRWLQFASFHFDVSVLEQYWSWSVGIRVVSAPRDLIFEDLAASIRKLEITHIDLTPSLARLVHPDEVPNLCRGVFIIGGEQLRQEVLDVWGPKRVIYNGYGPTEATIGVTMHQRVPANGRPANIGRQFLNVGSYVLHPGSNKPVLRGGVGELCVSGKLVGRGYLNRPDLTAERFPILSGFKERVYRTGDLVRILHDNSFDFIGRTDDQVKLRGQRLEIGEINATIKSAASDISDAVTLVLRHPNQQKEQLISFFASHSTRSPDEEALCDNEKAASTISSIHNACKNQLPSYMVPTHLIPLTSIPLSANNKADGNKLKEIYNELSQETLQSFSPSKAMDESNWTESEREVAKALSKASGINEDAIFKSSSIFELGVDSISAITLASILRKFGFKNAQISLVLKNPVVSSLAKALGSDARANSSISIIDAKQKIAAFEHQYKGATIRELGVVQNDVEIIAPCTPLQQGLISRSLENDKPIYFATFHFNLHSHIVIDELKAAWERVYQKAQILRTAFVTTDDGHAQVVLRNKTLPWYQEHMRNSFSIEKHLSLRFEKWWRKNRNDVLHPFEVLISRSPEKTVMTIHVFHALYDGISLPILLSKVEDEYRHRQAIDYGPRFHDVLPYGPLSISRGAREFWIKALSGTQSSRMPALSRTSVQTDVCVKQRLYLGDGLETVRRKLDVTHQSLVQACWTATLQRHFVASVTVGIVVSGRTIDYEGAENTVGPLFNTVPFSITFDANDDWGSVVRRCHDFNTSAMPFQHTPLRDISKWCTWAAKPLFDTLLVFQMRDSNSTNGSALWTPLEEQPQADYPLALEAEQSNDGYLNLTLISRSQTSDEDSSNELLHGLESSLTALISDHESRVSDTVGEIQPRPQANSHLESSSDVPYTNGVHSFEWTPQATMIRDEVAELAGVNHDDIDELSSILELGLDSIDAIKLSSRLKKVGVDLPVSVIMGSLTISRLALQAAENSSPGHPAVKEVDLNQYSDDLRDSFRRAGNLPNGSERILPVTPLQEAMAAEMFDSEFRRYFNHDILRLSDSIDLGRLERAWETVICHSPILRTTFAQIDDPHIECSFAQVVHKHSPTGWNTVEISHAHDLDSILESIRTRQQRGFARERLLGLTLARSANETYLVVSISHAMYDGWSLALLHNDVEAAYGGDFAPRGSYEPVLEPILNSSGPNSERFWQDYLSGARATTIPQRSTRSEELSSTVHREERQSNTPVDDISQFCKTQNISLQALGQTCWSLVLASLVGKLDVVFGVVLSGRDSEEAQEIMFPTMNTVPVRAILHGTRSDMLHYMQDGVSEIRQHQHFPLRKAKTFTESPGKALFDSLFIYQKASPIAERHSKPLYESVGGASHVEYPVCVEMELVQDQMIWRTACEDSILSRDGTLDLLAKIDSVLEGIIHSPLSSAVKYNGGDAAVCGLPSFKCTPHENNDLEAHALQSNGDSSATPWSRTELTIRQVLSAVSKVSEAEISKATTMFHIGLDSISAIKVSALLRKESMKLSVSQMLQAGTIENMAQWISEQHPGEKPLDNLNTHGLSDLLHDIPVESLLERAGISREDVEQVLPAGAGQVYLVSTWEQSEGLQFYPEFRYQVHGSPSESLVREAWNVVMERNPILRTILLATEHAAVPLVQVVNKAIGGTFRMTSSASQNEEATDLSANSQPFVACYARKEEEHWILHVKIHHALYDGVSLPLIMSQLQDHLNGNSIPETRDVFSDVLSLPASDEARADRKAFWSHYLQDSVSPKLPQPSRGGTSRFEVFRPAAVSTNSIQDSARSAGLSVHALFLAAYAKVYARTASSTSPSGADEPSSVVFGIYLANRSHPVDGLATLCAPTVNLVPLRVRNPTRNALAKLAREVQDDLREIGTPERSAVGLWEIERWTGVKIDSFVNFLKLPEADQDGDESGSEVTIREASDGKFDTRSTIVEPGSQKFELPDELKGNPVRDAYLHAVDVEAAVRASALDIGVFGPVEMLGREKAEHVIDGLVKELSEIEIAA